MFLGGFLTFSCFGCQVFTVMHLFGAFLGVTETHLLMSKWWKSSWTYTSAPHITPRTVCVKLFPASTVLADKDQLLRCVLEPSPLAQAQIDSVTCQQCKCFCTLRRRNILPCSQNWLPLLPVPAWQLKHWSHCVKLHSFWWTREELCQPGYLMPCIKKDHHPCHVPLLPCQAPGTATAWALTPPEPASSQIRLSCLMFSHFLPKLHHSEPAFFNQTDLYRFYPHKRLWVWVFKMRFVGSELVLQVLSSIMGQSCLASADWFAVASICYQMCNHISYQIKMAAWLFEI